MRLAIIIAQWPTNSQEGLTDVINQSPEEIRCNSIRIPPCHLRLLSDRGPHIHSCPHTCYHMLESNHHVRQQNIKCPAHQNWKKNSATFLFHSSFFFMCLWRHTHFLIWNCHKQKKKKGEVKPADWHSVRSVQDFLRTDREMERGTTYRISREWTKEHLTPECLTVTNTSTYMGCLSLCDRFSSLPHAAFFSFHLRALFLFVSVVCLCLAFVVMIIWAMSLHILCYFAVCLTNVPKILGHMLRHDNGWEDKKILWWISMK